MSPSPGGAGGALPQPQREPACPHRALDWERINSGGLSRPAPAAGEQEADPDGGGAAGREATPRAWSLHG